MLDTLLSIFAPHYCCNCSEVGGEICDNCKYDIVSERASVCMLCSEPTGAENLCKNCTKYYQKAWFVGYRNQALQKLIDDFKFSRVKSAHKALAVLLGDVLPRLPADTVIVSVPTVDSHVRQRGYDQVALVAKRLAKLRGLPYSRVLRRVGQETQRGASAKKRRAQAAEAFTVQGSLDPGATYLLIDDVLTTGATVEYAAKALRAAGAKKVWVAVAARQPSQDLR